MFRIVMCVAPCALPLGPPKSITRRYVPHTVSSGRALSLLVDDAAPVASAAPGAAIAVTSPESIARTASADLGIGRPVIVVSNVKGVGRE